MTAESETDPIACSSHEGPGAIRASLGISISLVEVAERFGSDNVVEHHRDEGEDSL